MILITGGMYQGKKDFVKEKFNLKESEILDFYDVTKSEKEDFMQQWSIGEITDKNHEIRAIAGCENYIRFMIEKEKNIDDIFKFWCNPALQECIFIFNDISMGIVPIDKKEREFREITGKTVTQLAKKAEKVYRIFCGIPMTLK